MIENTAIETCHTPDNVMPALQVMTGVHPNRRRSASNQRNQYANIRYPLRHHRLVADRENRTQRRNGIGLLAHFGNIRVRMVEYTPGYLADHWCSKGHIILCTDGELHTELKDGRKFTLKPGMSYQVADDAEPHRSYTALGAKLFIVD